MRTSLHISLARAGHVAIPIQRAWSEGGEVSPIVPTNGKDQGLWGELCCHTPAHVRPGRWAGWPPMACRAAGSLQPFTSGFCGCYPAGSWSPERLALCFPGQGTAPCPFPQGMCGKTRDPCASRCFGAGIGVAGHGVLPVCWSPCGAVLTLHLVHVLSSSEGGLH